MINTKALITVGTGESMAIARDVLALRGEHMQVLELARLLAMASAAVNELGQSRLNGIMTVEWAWAEIQMSMARVRIVCEQLETRHGDAYRIEHEDKELRSLMGEIAAQKSVVL